MYHQNRDTKMILNYWTNKDFQMGYDAHSVGEPLDKAQSEAWQMGWHEWEDDMTRSESVNYI